MIGAYTKYKVQHIKTYIKQAAEKRNNARGATVIEITDKQYWQLNELLPQPIKDANIATHAKTGEYAMLSPTVFRIRNAKGIVEDNDIAAVAAVLASGMPLFFRGRKQNAKITPSDAK